jgi:hypothetical protein
MSRHGRHGTYRTSSASFNQHQQGTPLERLQARNERDPMRPRTFIAAQGIVVLLSSLSEVEIPQLNWATHEIALRYAVFHGLPVNFLTLNEQDGNLYKEETVEFWTGRLIAADIFGMSV